MDRKERQTEEQLKIFGYRYASVPLVDGLSRVAVKLPSLSDAVALKRNDIDVIRVRLGYEHSDRPGSLSETVGLSIRLQVF